MRPATNDSPNQWLADYRTCSTLLGVPGQLLVVELEFGMTISWREHSHATWSRPFALKPLPRWSA